MSRHVPPLHSLTASGVSTLSSELKKTSPSSSRRTTRGVFHLPFVLGALLLFTTMLLRKGSLGSMFIVNMASQRRGVSFLPDSEQGSPEEGDKELLLDRTPALPRASATGARLEVMAQYNRREGLKQGQQERQGINWAQKQNQVPRNGSRPAQRHSQDQLQLTLQSKEERLGYQRTDISRNQQGRTEYGYYLEHSLKFTANSTLNFLHLHKTGGVSFKTLLRVFFTHKSKADGEKVTFRDACYIRPGKMPWHEKPTFQTWRCDWEPLRAMNASERNRHDVLVGHQFGSGGAGELLSGRHVRTFTVLRHPLERKVSFYYHFFVRELQRREADVTVGELRRFVVRNELPAAAGNANLGRDLGPNYVVGRLLSDGKRGYVGDKTWQYFEVREDEQLEVASRAGDVLRSFVFVGLQRENGASKCMLRRVVEAFSAAHGIGLDGADRIDMGGQVLNAGRYSVGAREVWEAMSEDERAIFKKTERVDTLVFEEGERLFRQQVGALGCAHRVVSSTYKR